MSTAMLRRLLEKGGTGKVNVPGVGMRSRSTIRSYISDPKKFQAAQKRVTNKSNVRNVSRARKLKRGVTQVGDKKLVGAKKRIGPGDKPPKNLSFSKRMDFHSQKLSWKAAEKRDRLLSLMKSRGITIEPKPPTFAKAVAAAKSKMGTKRAEQMWSKWIDDYARRHKLV